MTSIGNDTERRKIVMIGAGNLATNLGKALVANGYEILQVYSKTMRSASALATNVNAIPTDNIEKINTEADVYIVSIKDNAMPDIIPTLCKNKEEKVFIHTAGSIPLTIFKGMAEHYGVLYPMQTFSKDKAVNFNNIPCFIEGNDEIATTTVYSIATSISNNVRHLDSNARKQIHLAAVFACNFVNHCYEIASEILNEHNIPFEVMLPLIDETAKKVHTIRPINAQTGPAIRYDKNVINMQSDMLNNNPLLKNIYESMSLSIHTTSQKTTNTND